MLQLQNHSATTVAPPTLPPAHDLSPTLIEHVALTAPVVIGYVLSNGTARHDKFKCYKLSCAGVTFKRIQELKRHNNAHCDRGAVRFSCPVDGCGRSMKSGSRAFPRKDKMIDHLERVHGDKIGSGGSE
jgi:hypothetical protein